MAVQILEQILVKASERCQNGQDRIITAVEEFLIRNLQICVKLLLELHMVIIAVASKWQSMIGGLAYLCRRGP